MGDQNEGQELISQPGNKQKQRYYITRTAACILIPPIILAYYIWIYVTWLRPGSNPTSTAVTHLANGKYVWWSWFVISTVGLNISNYCLAGIEPGLLTSPHFKIGDGDHDKLIHHLDSSWSTLGAWSIFGQSLWDAMARKGLEKRDKKATPGLAWKVLFCMSALSWVFVLSGLTMNTETDFARGDHAGASVIGVNGTTMNTRVPFTVVDSAYQLWRYGSQPQIPSWGSVYTQSGSTNASTLKSFPADASKGVFLAPQATVPVTGSVWGLLLRYNCTGIYQMTDFTILNQRINSTNPAYIRNYTDPHSFGNWLANANYYYELDSMATINVLSELWGSEYFRPLNILAFAEIGLSPGFNNLTDSDVFGYGPPQGIEGGYKGLEEEDILEVLLWQSSVNLIVNATSVEDPIPGLEGEHHDIWGRPMPAIGIRCTSSSATGNAVIDGLAGTFSDFSRSDPTQSYLADVPRIGIGMPVLLLPGNMSDTTWDIYDELSFTDFDQDYTTYTLVGTDLDWVDSLFTAAGMRTVLNSTGFVTYLSAMQREDLERGVEQAYKHYALQLMFNGQENILDEWTSPTLTPAVPWPILVSGGGVPPLLVLVLLSIWALGCLGFGLVYGTRKRWRATFDGFSFYELCKDQGIDPMRILKIS